MIWVRGGRITGEPLEPIPCRFLVVGGGGRRGDLRLSMPGRSIRAVEKIPGPVCGEVQRDLVEAALVTQARLTHPGEVAKAGQLLLARIDQDGEEPP